MSVYVDPITRCAPDARWRWDGRCHLFGDSEAELVAFAKRLGLDPRWMNDSPGFRHFDLSPGKRALAVRLGAVEIGRRFVVERARITRAHLPMPKKDLAADVAKRLDADQVMLFVRQIGPDGKPTLRFVSWGATPEHRHEAARLADFAYEGLIDGMREEEVRS